MVIIALMNAQNFEFRNQVCKDLSSQLALDYFLQECESRLVYAPWPGILAKRLAKKFNSISSKSKLEAFLASNSINIEGIDIQLLAKKVLSQFEASELDFLTLKPLLDSLINIQENLIGFALTHILAISLEFRYKHKKEANRKMLNLLMKTCSYLTKTNQNTEQVEKTGLNKLGRDKNSGCRRRILKIVEDLEEEERLEKAQQNELRRSLINEQLTIFEKLQPMGFLDKICLIGTERDIPLFVSEELDEILNDM